MQSKYTRSEFTAKMDSIIEDLGSGETIKITGDQLIIIPGEDYLDYLYFRKHQLDQEIEEVRLLTQD